MIIKLDPIGLDGDIEVKESAMNKMVTLFKNNDTEKLFKEIESEVEEILENMSIDEELTKGTHEKPIKIAVELNNDASTYNEEEFYLSFKVDEFNTIEGKVE